MGETGPCGPCSEIHIDRGPDACDRQAPPAPLRGERRLRALHRDLEPRLHPEQPRRRRGALADLPAKHVDTGMGFERIAAVLQGVPSNYDIDLFQTIIAARRAARRQALPRERDATTSRSA